MPRYPANVPIAVHPGDILREMLDDRGISQSQLARHLHTDVARINEICRRRRGISAEMAMLLGKAFGTSADLWMNLQKNWELSQVDPRCAPRDPPLARLGLMPGAPWPVETVETILGFWGVSMNSPFQFPKFEEIREIIQLARREDLGHDDVTSRLMVGEDVIGVGTLLQKETGVTCGLPLVEMICRVYDERLRVELIPGFHLDIIEGRYSDARTMPLLRLRGPMRSLLAAERVILNFLQHLSGVATHTHRFVRRISGTGAAIYDTRKTLPGLRVLEKYAVRCGGGQNLRMGLFDGLLVKDNHIAAIPLKELSAFLSQAVQRSRAESSDRFIEIEVDSLDQLREVLKVENVNVILLDNMDCPKMQSAVELRDRAGKKGKTALEASGGVTLETVRSIAMTGVERIAVGAITHSAPALDIGMDIEI